MAIQTKSSVMIKCKKCGQEAPADSFRLDYEYKTVVCPSCFSRKPRPNATGVKNTPIGDSTPGFKPASRVFSEKEENDKQSMSFSPRVKNVATPIYDDEEIKVRKDPKAGWDRQDEFLELEMIKRREDENKFRPGSARGSSVVGPDIIQVKCYYCNYTFKYNVEKQTPRKCPNCEREVDNSLY